MRPRPLQRVVLCRDDPRSFPITEDVEWVVVDLHGNRRRLAGGLGLSGRCRRWRRGRHLHWVQGDDLDILQGYGGRQCRLRRGFLGHRRRGHLRGRIRRVVAHDRVRGVGGEVGDSDPFTAISDVLSRREIDEIIVSTLPTGTSRWLRAGLPTRVRREFNVPVTAVISRAAQRV